MLRQAGAAASARLLLSPGSKTLIASNAAARWGHPARWFRRTSSWLPAEFATSRLRNGMRVTSAPLPHARSVAVGVFVDSGSRTETLETNGAAHFLEHLLFKGTKTRSAKELELQVEDMGATFNAYTSREQTVYYIAGPPENLRDLMDLLSDVLRNSRLDWTAIEQERSVILREMEEVEKSADEVVFDKLHEVCFPGQTLGLTILGPPANIATLTQQDIQNYVAANYTGSSMAVVAAGKVDHELLRNLSQKYFSSFSAAPRGRARKSIEPAKFHPGQVFFETLPSSLDDADKQSMTSVLGAAAAAKQQQPTSVQAVAWEAVGWTDPRHMVLMVVQQLIGSYEHYAAQGINSERSSKTVAAELAEAYNNSTSTIRGLDRFDDSRPLLLRLQSFNACYKDTGLLGFLLESATTTTSTTPSKAAVEAAAARAVRGVESLATVSAASVELAKKRLKLALLGQIDTVPVALCEEVGRQLLSYGKPLSAADIVRWVDQVTVGDVRACVKNLICDRPPARVAIGVT